MQFWEHRKISGIAVFEVSGSYRIQIQCIASSAGSILIEIEELTILTQFFRIEIVKRYHQIERFGRDLDQTFTTLGCESVFIPRVFSTKTQDFTPMFLKSVVEVHLFLLGNE